MQRIIGSLLAVALWLTVWLSPLLLTMAAGCLLVWAVQVFALSWITRAH